MSQPVKAETPTKRVRMRKPCETEKNPAIPWKTLINSIIHKTCRVNNTIKTKRKKNLGFISAVGEWSGKSKTRYRVMELEMLQFSSPKKRKI